MDGGGKCDLAGIILAGAPRQDRGWQSFGKVAARVVAEMRPAQIRNEAETCARRHRTTPNKRRLR